MLPIFDGLRDVTLASVTTRMLLAVLCGGLIGIERAYKRRPAGFRTHILICLGAAMTTLTSQFLYLEPPLLHGHGPSGRAGGGGHWLHRRRYHHCHPAHRVKGLTTAAGLWAAAIIGLAWAAASTRAALRHGAVLVAESFLSHWSTGCWTMCRRSISTWSTVTRPAWTSAAAVPGFEPEGALNMEITRSPETETHNACALFTLRLNKRCRVEQLIPVSRSNAHRGWIRAVVSVEELP